MDGEETAWWGIKEEFPSNSVSAFISSFDLNPDFSSVQFSKVRSRLPLVNT